MKRPRATSLWSFFSLIRKGDKSQIMTLIKNEIPILEYDTEPMAVIMPGHKQKACLPRKAVLAFLQKEVEEYAFERSCEVVLVFESMTKSFPIYKTTHNGCEVAFCQVPVGAAAATQILEFFIAHGATEVVAVGCCGTLVDMEENQFLIPTEALRDEGTSYHYLPPQRTISLHTMAIRAIEVTLGKRGVAYKLCKTWTTDGFFRETAEMVAYRIAEGCSVVEMECAALAACAEFRGILFGQLLFTADSLADVQCHDIRQWGKASYQLALELAFDAVREI